MTEIGRMLFVPDSAERDDLGAFTARVVRLDATALIRLKAGEGQVGAWAPTPFDVLVTRSVRGDLCPPDLTVSANELLAALAVVREARVDPGSPSDARWHAELPPATGWRTVEHVPVDELDALAERGIALARERGGASGALLDQTVLTAVGAEVRIQVPLRCLFALSGMGFLGGGQAGDQVRISATEGGGGWLRLDARYGAAVRRRRTLLPLLL